MPRLTKARANQLFTASSKKGEQVQSDVEKERRAKAALTAKLRALRLAKEEQDAAAKPTAKSKKKAPAKASPNTVRV